MREWEVSSQSAFRIDSWRARGGGVDEKRIVKYNFLSLRAHTRMSELIPREVGSEARFALEFNFAVPGVSLLEGRLELYAFIQSTRDQPCIHPDGRQNSLLPFASLYRA
jgi:hypothetical protein